MTPSVRAAAAQRSLDHHFGGPFGSLRSAHPTRLQHAGAFDYWWLAHGVDARIDAYLRSGDARRLDDARRLARFIRLRNGGRLVNGYFDDMMWLGCALLRLGLASGEERWLDGADRLWRFASEHGWNLRHGASLAWRRAQLDYKNAPANGPFAILGAGLEAVRPAAREERSRAAFDWMHVRLRDEATGFVADGIGRDGDSALDTRAFSYNHGVYVGAALALDRLRPDDRLIGHATRTALDAIDRLAPDGVFADQGAGDGGLFGGIWYRYAVDLLLTDRVEPEAAGRLRSFVTDSVDTLWRTSAPGGRLLAGPRFDEAATLPVSLSAELGAVIATEAAARLHRR